MSVIATTTLDNDEDLLMPRKLWDDLQKKGFEGVGEKSDEDDSDGSEESDGGESSEENKYSDDDSENEDGEEDD